MHKNLLITIALAVLSLAGISQTKPKEQSDTNLAIYRVVYHSSSAEQNHCGHLVVDGSDKTYWESQPGTDNFITIDLGASHTIHKAIIRWRANFGTEYQVIALHSAESDGTKIFSTLLGDGGVDSIDFPAIETRFIKVNISNVKDPIRGSVIIMGKGEDRFVPSEITALSEDDLSLNKNIWRIQNTMFVEDKSANIAGTGYNDTYWIPASVPGTVLESYYDFGALPDPLYGDNMHQISDEFFSGNDFWYRTTVSLPSGINDKHLFLDFSGINWKSDIYFNSHYLGRIDGAYIRAEFDVTRLLNKTGANTIAVLVHHPDHWESSTQKVNRKFLGARTTNGDVMGLDSPTCLASAGWNWLPIIKGRNMGIWNDVTFRVAGSVSIIDPWVSSILSLPDTTKADLTIHTGLKNTGTQPVKGTLVASFGKTKIQKDVVLNPGESKDITLDKTEFAKLSVSGPKLWWPNGYGQQNLERLILQFTEDGKISDTRQINFGIRMLESKVENNILYLYCNGQRLLIRGGNWGLPEAMMRCDSLGYDIRVKLHKDANFNMIRNWVGMTNHEAFYDACDRYGLLIFDDFWLANPVDGPDPKDTTMFMNNVRDKILWVRKHPSLALYCGRNEGLPPVELDVAMKHETEILDGTRFYIPHSAAGTVTGLGPYDVRNPEWYFNNRGKTFHSEQGIIAFPEVESMRRMMAVKDLWPINDMWAIHDYQWGRSEKFTDTIIARFGRPTSLEDYCRRAQLHNYESAKAIFECLQSNQGSGLLLWMSQSAWPSMICQLYDHYFEYTASFFAVKKACQPVHILWNASTGKICIANNTQSDLKDAIAKATVYDQNGIKIWEKSFKTDVTSSTAKTCFELEHQPANKVNFLKLELSSKDKLMDNNFYWLENKAGNCLDLNDLPAARIIVRLNVEHKNGIYSVRINLKNESSVISLLNKIKVKDKNTGESILPVFFDDDYVSILPDEEKTIILKIEENALLNKSPEIYLEGWNTESSKMDLIKN
jgi:hypothetical protein